MFMLEKREAAEITKREAAEMEPTRSLPRAFVYDISCIRGLSSDKYSNYKSRRIINSLKKGILEALEKKYLKKLSFYTCKKKGLASDEHAFLFSYPVTNVEEVVVYMSQKRSKISNSKFTAETTPELRTSASNIIQMLFSVLISLDPEEHSILMKLRFYDDATPEDYAPPFFKFCAKYEPKTVWNKNPLKMEMGKINYASDPSIGDHMKADKGSNQVDYCYEIEVHLSEELSHTHFVASRDCTQDIFHGDEQESEIRDWILSRQSIQGGYMKNSADIHLGLGSAAQDEATGRMITEMKKMYNGKGEEKEESLKLQQNVSIQRSCQGLIYGVMCLFCTNPKIYPNLDSGASNHICGRNEWFTPRNWSPRMNPDNYFLNAANRKVNVSSFGDIISKQIRLYDVYLSNNIEQNELYVSIGQLTAEGYDVKVDSKGRVTIHLSKNFNHIVGRVSMNVEMKGYVLHFFNGSVLEGMDNHSEEDQLDQQYDTAKGEWILDSGSPHHITRQQSFLTEQWKMRKKELSFAGSKKKFKCQIKGNVKKDGISLKDVYLCQGSASNLVSVPQLNALGYNFFFSGSHCHVRYKEADDIVGLAHRDEDTKYYVEFLNSVE